VRWSLTLIKEGLHLAWPSALLQHELGEEVAMRALLVGVGKIHNLFRTLCVLSTRRDCLLYKGTRRSACLCSASQDGSGASEHACVVPLKIVAVCQSMPV
jgi:hypothetical protein